MSTGAIGRAPAIKDAIWQVHQSAAINHLSLK